MARTIQEIKKSMTDGFMSDSTLRSAYGITEEGATWDNVFSTVSIENTLMYIVAVCTYALEVMFDAFRKDVDDRIARNIVPTVRWYHTQALAFQYGDRLVYDEQTQAFRYAMEDSTKQIVKYCAVKDRGSSIQILVSRESGGLPAVIPDEVLAAFKAYMNSVKIAGVILDIRSLPADSIRVAATIQIDPQVIGTDGRRISDGTYPVREAVDNYLRSIVYGGTFNKTKCVDALQNVEGVVDIALGDVQAKASSTTEYAVVEGNNYTAVAGCFISNNLDSTLTYVV